MKTFNIYSARLTYNQSNKFLGTLCAENLEDVKKIIGLPLSENGLQKNPFYSVIFCIDNVLDKDPIYNKHLPFYKG